MAVAPDLIDRVDSELAGALGPDQVSRAEAVREQHGGGETYHPVVAPDLVVYPESTEDVVAIVGIAAGAQVPIIPHGAGTSLEGHLAALRGGISIDTSRMNAILRMNAEDLDVTVQAGVTRKQLDAHLQPNGLFFPVDPGADASIGGMAATRATGTTAVLYGGMRENVIALNVVTASGDVLKTASRAPKSSAGYDLTHLFVGSEGTLGVITDITLRVYGTPEAIASAVCSFPTVDDAVQSAMHAIQLGIPVARIELLDEVQMDGCRQLLGLDLAIAPTLFLEFHGSEASVAEQAAEFGEVAGELGGSDFTWAREQEARNKLWEARHMAYQAALALRPGCKGIATDVCVPISQLAASIESVRNDIDEQGLVAAIVGHVGDGNFHVVFALDPTDSDELERALAVNDRMVRLGIEVEGTSTGEHGVGYGKGKYLELEHGAPAVAAMRSIKEALDPDGIMNPGKVLEVGPALVSYDATEG